MTKTTTGYDPRLGRYGAGRVQELLRRGHRVWQEATNDPVASGYARTCDVLRFRQTAAGSTAAGIEPTFAQVAGLTGISCTVYTLEHVRTWKERPTATAELNESERVVALVDVPATATEGADVVLLSDHLVIDDDVYGNDAVFRVTALFPFGPAGVIHARCEYARRDGEAP